ncbi:MAG: GNAT family N-acetyltransferase [Spirochaetes bacterium]|nr:GNAT family N-acetyltransferase [Spirochaetota bacterium]
MINFRYRADEADIENVRRIVSSSSFFNSDEIDIAVELVVDNYEKNDKSDYRFIFADEAGFTAGYSCFGHIGGTESSYDLYWIAVDESLRGKGTGKKLLEETVSALKALGGGRLYAETSSKEQYAPTRHFYLSNGFFQEAFIDNFYAPGDGKLIYTRVISGINA